MDQLNRVTVNILLLELLMHLVTHRTLLMKIVSGAHVEQDISLDNFEGIVSNNYLTFTDDEVPAKGIAHNKALVYL